MSALVKLLPPILFASTTTFAATITYEGEFINLPGSYPASYASEVPKFNPALGDLESVELYLQAEAGAIVEIESEGPTATNGTARIFGITTGTFSNLNTTLVLGRQLIKIVGPDDEVGAPNFAGEDYQNFGLLSDTKSASTTATTLLSPYIGTNGLELVITDNQAWTVGGMGDSANRISGSGSTTHWAVTYTFSPTPLPEPCTAGLGLIGITGWAMRRRRQALVACS